MLFSIQPLTKSTRTVVQNSKSSEDSGLSLIFRRNSHSRYIINSKLPLLQSSVSHDPSEITPKFCFGAQLFSIINGPQCCKLLLLVICYKKLWYFFSWFFDEQKVHKNCNLLWQYKCLDWHYFNVSLLNKSTILLLLLLLLFLNPNVSQFPQKH